MLKKKVPSLNKNPEFFFELAQEALSDSKIAIDNESFRMSTNRSYYATFYAATALLLKKGLYFKTHAWDYTTLLYRICSE
ncbi:MAG: Pseudogene of HEPN domain-containing protein [Methanobrevibacter sp. CfCl-M3]